MVAFLEKVKSRPGKSDRPVPGQKKIAQRRFRVAGGVEMDKKCLLRIHGSPGKHDTTSTVWLQVGQAILVVAK